MRSQPTASYCARLDAALTAAGQGDEGWNRRFRMALAERGLALRDTATFIKTRGFEALLQVYFAPVSYGTAEGWPADTVVVEASEARP